MRTTAVLLIGICGLLAKAFVGQSDSWGRLPSRSVAPAALWDQFLPKDPVDVPLNASALSNRLQDVIFTVMKKGLPQVDIDLPAGLILGVEGPAIRPGVDELLT
ncbi:unnamed protein product [Effrenium voratum]|nr:unnamed protein product [Effrenium voratum]